MNEILENLLERPGKQKLSILIVTIILIAALYYSFLYSPRADEVAKLADSVEIAQNEKKVKTEKSANLLRLRKDLQQLDVELRKAVAQLPDKREIAELLSGISAKAQRGRARCCVISPQTGSLSRILRRSAGRYHRQRQFS